MSNTTRSVLFYDTYISINKRGDFVYKEKVLVIHIQELVKKHNISLRELSRRADIDIARLSELSSGKRQRINIEYIERIAEALNIDDIREILTIEDK
ncbi:MAG: helix-turn-helix transcriptional regulator [Enterococcus casseliflavus]|jgi:DNA-binding Xre family transcriptional regulator|nr:helix-turn-helix transcriptional regulator [Enterococcus casseliflavus]